MSSSPAMESTSTEIHNNKNGVVGKQQSRGEMESEMDNVEGDDDVTNLAASKISEIDNITAPSTSESHNERQHPTSGFRGISHQGEMERRAEERLLDERIRERYQREIGDIFAKS